MNNISNAILYAPNTSYALLRSVVCMKSVKPWFGYDTNCLKKFPSSICNNEILMTKLFA